MLNGISKVTSPMELQQYCVYNLTCECFLSLGVMLFEGCFSQPTEIMGEKALRLADGSWLTRFPDKHAFVVSSPCDLIYLDLDLRVIQVVESFPALRLARWRQGAASVLALPLNALYASQTRSGHQLLIKVAAEMEELLRNIASRDISLGSNAQTTNVEAGKSFELQIVRAAKAEIDRA